jgi:radical SAM superfamily enzyme
MMKTVDDVAALHPDQVKIHLLHVLKGTEMARMYENGEYTPLEKDEYVSLVADTIERLPEDTVIARLTGDGMASDLLAPLWSIKKVSVINDIDKLLYERGTYQGIGYGKTTV